jgi:hypothetical protein
MFGHVHDDGLFPAEQKISRSSTDDHGKTQPNIVGHEDEHQHVADYQLNYMKGSLEGVDAAKHRGSATTNLNLHF